MQRHDIYTTYVAFTSMQLYDVIQIHISIDVTSWLLYKVTLTSMQHYDFYTISHDVNATYGINVMCPLECASRRQSSFYNNNNDGHG